MKASIFFTILGLVSCMPTDYPSNTSPENTPSSYTPTGRSPTDDDPSGDGNQWQGCLSQDDAQDIVDKFISFLGHSGDANATAQALLDDGYQEISDSINSLAGNPLGSVTFSGKQSYIAGVLGEAATTGIQTEEVDIAGCSKILWYWTFTEVGNKQQAVKGFNLFTINDDKQITKSHLEFNSIAWGIDLGYTVTPPSGGAVQ